MSITFLSSWSDLERRYGGDGARTIADALHHADPAVDLLLADVADPGGRRLEPAALTALVQEHFARIGAPATRPLLILGGHDVVPFHEVANPVADRRLDPDRYVLTDAPYGAVPTDGDSRNARLLTPGRPVARLPDPEPPDIDVFLRMIRGVLAPVYSDRVGVFATVNDAWADHSAGLLARAGWHATVRRSPPWSTSATDWHRNGARVLYFKLHGFPGRGTWHGYSLGPFGRWVVGARPENMTADAVADTIVVTENCYGAEIRGRSSYDTIPLRMLELGATAYVGSTGLAYESFWDFARPVPEHADELAHELLEGLGSGKPVGAALVDAKRRLRAHNSDLSPFDEKTLLQFVLYGNPLATV